MKRYTFAALLVAAGLVGLPAVSGCEEKDTQEKTIEMTTPEGETVMQKVTTEKDGDGNIKAKQETTVDGEKVDEKKIEVDVDEK